MSDQDSLDSITALISALVEQGIHRFNPVRFTVIESMLHRAQVYKPAVQDIVATKIRRSLIAYQKEFLSEKNKALVIFERIASRYPHANDCARQLLETHNFSALKRLEIDLCTKQPSLLRELTAELCRWDTETEEAPPPCLTEQLYQQEKDIFQSPLAQSFLMQSSLSPLHDSCFKDTAGRPKALKSFRLLKASLNRIQTDKKLSKVLQAGPANPGPLNAHRLVIRTLTAMNQLSKDYTARMLHYLETVLCLDEVERINYLGAGTKKGNQKPSISGRK